MNANIEKLFQKYIKNVSSANYIIEFIPFYYYLNMPINSLKSQSELSEHCMLNLGSKGAMEFAVKTEHV